MLKNKRLMYLILFAVIMGTAAISRISLAQQIVIEETAGISRISEPVTLGIPFIEGELASDAPRRIIDGNGSETPTQFSPMAFWADGSIKWLKADFQANVGANLTTNYRFEQTSASGYNSPLSIDESGTEFTITTGPMKLIISKVNFNIFDQVWVDLNNDGSFTADELIVNPGSEGPAERQGNEVFLSSFSTPAEIAIEEQGPMRITLRISGRQANQNGQSLKYETRITVFAGQSYVKLWHVYANGNSVENLGNSLDPSLQIDFDQYALSLDLNLSGDKNIQFGIENGADYTTILSGNESITMLQEDNRSISSAQLSFDISKDGSSMQSGEKSAGWGAISGTTKSVIFGSQYFWQKYPKGLTFGADGTLSLELAPNPETLYIGMGTGDEIWFDFGGQNDLSAATQAMEARLSAPLFARATPEQFVKSNVFYNLYAGDAPNANMQEYVDEVTQNHPAGVESAGLYGNTNFGDSPRSIWEAFTDNIDASTWGGNYYDGNILTPARLFAQTGDLRYADVFVPGARMWMETIAWNSNDESNFMYGYAPAYSAFHREIDHFQAHYGEGIWYYYYLTGDERAKEIGMRAANSIVNQQWWANQNIDGRMAYQRGSAVLEAWKATRDSVYFNHARHILVDKIIDHQDQFGLIGGHWEETGGLRGEQAFMMALYSDALWKFIQEYDEKDPERVRLSQKMALLADFMDIYARKSSGVEDYWNFFDAPNNNVPPAADMGDYGGDETVYWWGRGLIIGLYAYAYDLTDDVKYKTLAENALADHWSSGAIDWGSSQLWCKATGQGMKNMIHAVAILEGQTTGVEDDYDVQSIHRLLQNYPNPFNERTLIQYKSQASQQIKLAVYDLLGREVNVLVDEIQAGGTYQVNFDAKALPAGVYFYQLTIGGQTETKMMTVLR